MAKKIGFNVVIGGDVSQLNKSLREANSAASQTTTGLKSLQKAAKLDPGNYKTFLAIQKDMAAQADAAKKKLDTLKSAKERMDKAFEEGKISSKEWADYNAELKQAEENYKKLTKAAKDYNPQMAQIGQKLTNTGEKLKDVGSKIQGVGNKLSTHLTLPLAAAGAAMVKAASDFDENVNKIDVAFGNSAQSVKDWAETATEQFGLSKNAALEAAAQFGDMGTSMGLSQSAAADMSVTLAGLAGDLASFKNISTDQAMTALNGVFTGETESLKTLGVVMTQTNLEDFAARQNKVYDSMSESEKVTLRYQYVLSKTKNAQGDYARTSDGTANSLRTLQASLENLAITFGQELLPVITPLIGDLTDMVKAFGALPAPIRKFIVATAGVTAAVGPALSGIGSITMGLGGLSAGLGKIIPKLGGTALAGAATQSATAVAGVGTAAATTGVTLSSVLVPALLVVGAALAGILIGKAIADNWDNITAAAKKVGDGVKNGFDKAVTAIRNSKLAEAARTEVNSMTAAYKSAGGGVSGAVAAMFAGIRTKAQLEFRALDSLTNGKLSGTVRTVQGKFREIGSSITTSFRTLQTNTRNELQQLQSAVAPKAQQIGQTIKNGFSTAVKGAATLFAPIKSAVATLASTTKPYFDQFAKNINGGVGAAIEKVKASFQGLGGSLGRALSSAASSVSSGWDAIKRAIKLPHFSIRGSFSLKPLSVPTIRVDWYKKAMENGMILDQPTVFGAMNGKLLAGGEAGREAVVGVDSLRGMIQDAVGQTINNNSSTNMGGVTINVYAQPGQDVNDLARVIENRLTTSVQRRKAAFA